MMTKLNFKQFWINGRYLTGLSTEGGGGAESTTISNQTQYLPPSPSPDTQHINQKKQY
jgi:hypothetical protein